MKASCLSSQGYVSKADDAYHSLCTAGKWHVNTKATGHFTVICWNFEKE